MEQKDKLLYIAIRLDVTGDGASIYAMNNLLAFNSVLPTDVITLKNLRTTTAQQQLTDTCCRLIEVEEEPYNQKQARLLLLKRGHNIFRESHRLREKVCQQIKIQSYQIIVLELYTAYLMEDIRKLSPTSKIILCQHNYEFANHLEYIRYRIKSPIKKVLYKLANCRYRAVEHICIQKADAVIAISEQDKLRFRDISHENQPVFVMYPAVNFTKQKSTYRATCRNILCLGMMDWYPNIEGVIEFIHQVFYPLLATDNSYHLYVVGKNPVKEIVRYQSAHITITGAVPSVDDYIKISDLLVVPNTLGGGVKIKVMEAIQKGIPLLISPQSAVGYEGLTDYFVAAHAEDFIRRIKNYSEEIDSHVLALSEAQQKLADRTMQNRVTVQLIISTLTENLISKI